MENKLALKDPEINNECDPTKMALPIPENIFHYWNEIPGIDYLPSEIM